MEYPNKRYIVRLGSESSHCCFKATVLDSSEAEVIPGIPGIREDRVVYHTVCECFEVEAAEKVCDALNKLAMEAELLSALKAALPLVQHLEAAYEYDAPEREPYNKIVEAIAKAGG